MRKGVLLVALIGLAVGEAQLASAGDDRPVRGTTYTTDSDVSRFRPKPGASTTEIYVLRGTDPKDTGSVTVAPEPAAKEKEEAPKPNKIRRGRYWVTPRS